jgi:hypothetical protein
VFFFAYDFWIVGLLHLALPRRAPMMQTTHLILRMVQFFASFAFLVKVDAMVTLGVGRRCLEASEARLCL